MKKILLISVVISTFIVISSIGLSYIGYKNYIHNLKTDQANSPQTSQLNMQAEFDRRLKDCLNDNELNKVSEELYTSGVKSCNEIYKRVAPLPTVHYPTYGEYIKFLINSVLFKLTRNPGIHLY